MLHGCPREQNLVHHSGSGRLAKPSPWGTFTSYSLPAFLAHSASGQTQTHTPHRWVGAHAADGKEKAEGKLDGRPRRTRDKSESSPALGVGKRIRARGAVEVSR